jgi:orotidine-5'-phosphate decarboxylase
MYASLAKGREIEPATDNQPLTTAFHSRIPRSTSPTASVSHPAGAAAGDQARVLTPKAAITAGATCLVVGRPILDAPDPAQAAAGILQEIDAAESVAHS